MNKNFLGKLFKIALPVSLQNLIGSSINMADVFMIGRLGTEQVAGVGLANQITFLCILFLFGINNTSAIFISQYYGKRDLSNIKKVISLSAVLSLGMTVIFTLISLFIPEKLMMLYSKDPAVIEIASQYLRVIAWSYVITGFSVCYSTSLRGMGKTQVAMYASIVALFTNVGLNYLLIFGNLGFPKMGVTGAAVATTIARTLELAFMYWFSNNKNYGINVKKEDLLKNNMEFLKEFLKKGLPVLGSHMVWSLGTTVTMAIYARIGTVALTSMQIAGAVFQIASTGIIGIGSATGVLVGQELGRKKIQKAIAIAKRLTGINFSVGMLIGVSLLFFIDDIIKFYNITEEAKNQTKLALKYYCIIIPFSTVCFTNMTGTLRAGGDTKSIFIIDTICMWGVSVPLALWGLKMGFPISLVYFISVGGDVFTKFVLSMHRMLGLKWAKSLV